MSLASAPAAARRCARFGPFAVDLLAGEVRRNGRRVRLQEKPFQLLAALLETAGEPVTREQLYRRLWETDTFVDFDNNLNTAANKLREALGDAAARPRYLETLPKRGYRFIAPVEWGPPDGHPAAEEAEPRRPRAWRRPGAWLLGAAVLAVIAAASVTLRPRPAAGPAPAAPPAPRVTVAVLPFQSLTPGEAHAAWTLGLGDDLIGRLEPLLPQGLAVVARASADVYADASRDVRAVGRDLGAQYVLRGSVRHEAGRVRVHAQLVRSADAHVVWAETLEGAAAGSVSLQDEITARIARTVGVRVQAGGYLPRPEAHEAYLEGLYLLRKGDEDGHRRAQARFEAAIARDPRYAAAHAARADALCRQSRDPREVMPLARASAERALALEPGQAEAHHRLALIALYFDWDWEGARAHFERALSAKPGWSVLHHSHAGYFASLGRHDEAAKAMARARGLDPVGVAVAADAGWYEYVARRYDAALRETARALELEPGHQGAVFYALLAHSAKGDWERARAAAARYAALRGDPGAADLGRGPPAEAVRRFWAGRARSLEDDARRGYVSPIPLALAEAALGHHPRAIQLLEQAHAQRAGWIVPFLRVYPALDPLRGEARFAALLSRIPFPAGRD
jgi:TolB-like protein/Tfp pilus assembly protein PilF